VVILNHPPVNKTNQGALQEDVMEEFIGQFFGKWEVIGISEEKTKRGHNKLLCKCECGIIRAVDKYRLLRGKSKSCGNKGPCAIRKDLTGQRFGKLVVIGLSESRTTSGRIKWDCICDCGAKKSVAYSELHSGVVTSCGCDKSSIKDLIGQRFGKLVVIEASEERTKSGGMKWACKCDCGNTRIVSSRLLVTGVTISCGCYREKRKKAIRSNKKELTGQRFGRLLVLNNTKDKNTHWDCLCNCGNVVSVITNSLVSGKTISCGCFQKERISEAHFTHGKSGTPVYKKWIHMRERCYNIKDKNYHNYGGRGITVCGRWLGKDGSLNFFNDMGECPEGYELDRIDNNGNYEPDNCRWASHMEQCRNRRPNIFVSIFGLTLCLKDVCNLVGTDYKKVHYKWKRGWPMSWSIFGPYPKDYPRGIKEAAKERKALNALKY
jgi:hypothetical protein